MLLGVRADESPPAPAPRTASAPRRVMPPGKPLTPYDGWKWALADARLGGLQAKHWRYLWVGPLSQEERKTFAASLTLHVNQLSTEPNITPPDWVGDGSVLRIDATAYGDLFGEAWEQLAGFDPYFHLPIVKEVEEEVDQEYGYRDRNGRFVTTRTQREVQKRKKFIAAATVWGDVLPQPVKLIYAEPVVYLDYLHEKQRIYVAAETQAQRADVEQLIGLTGSKVPVVYGPWFVYQTAIQQDRSPAGYADFLGFKDERGYFKLIGFDQKIIDKFPLDLADVIAESRVAVRKKPRAILVKGKAGGHVWITLDVDRPVDDANPVRVFDPEKNLKIAAKEELGQLPNGLWASGLFNADGTRQDFAPQNIALDAHGDNQDLNVHLGTISCNRCHTEAGLNDLKPYVRDVLNTPPLQLNTIYDVKTDAERLRARRLYLATLSDPLDEDRYRANRAMARCGDEPKRLMWNYLKGWEDYRDSAGPDRCARELGFTRRQLRTGLDRFLRSTGQIDPVIAALVATKQGNEAKARLAGLNAGQPIQAEMWLEAYPLTQLAVRQYVPAALPAKADD